MVDGHHLENYISNNAESINAKTGQFTTQCKDVTVTRDTGFKYDIVLGFVYMYAIKVTRKCIYVFVVFISKQHTTR